MGKLPWYGAAWFCCFSGFFVCFANTKDVKKPNPIVLAVGDSLTEGYGVPGETSWPSLLEAHLHRGGFPHAQVINSGSSGATTAFGLRAIRFHVKRRRPDLVIYALGSNDGLRGHKPPEIKKNITDALNFLQKTGVKVILAGLKAPPNYGPEYFGEFAKIFPALAKEFHVPLIPFLLDGVARVPKLNLADGIHPNEKGYQVIAENLYPYVLDSLQSNIQSKGQPKKGPP